MKNRRQYRDSAMFTLIGYIGIILVVLVMTLGIGTKTGIKDYDSIEEEMLGEMELHWDTINKETKVWTGTTQGERTYEEMLSIEPDYIYYDTTGSQREQDSIDDYMRHWYGVLDTNSDGKIDKNIKK